MAPPQQEPNWQPLSRLPLIAEMITGMADTAATQRKNLTDAAARPGVLDNATVERVVRSYTQQQGDLWLYEEQLRRWQAGPLTPAQQREIAGLAERLAALRSDIAAILALAEQSRSQTIEAILGRSDAELGLEALLGQRTPRGRPKPGKP